MATNVIKEIEFHPAADAFPLMEGEDFESLKADVEAHGLRESITLFEGKILDGRNRFRACRAAGIEPRFEDWRSDNGDSPLDFVVSRNLRRRHLTESQRAMAAAELKPLFEAEARERQAHGQTAPGKTLSANLREASRGKASEKAAAKLNVSPRSVETAARVVEKGVPELKRAVKEGKVSVSAAAKVAALPRAEQEAAVKEGPKGIKARAKKASNPKKPKAPPADSEAEADVEEVVGEDADETPAERKAREEREWLETFPIRPKLTDRCRATFDADALHWREAREVTEALRKINQRFERARPRGQKVGAFAGRAEAFARIPHPRGGEIKGKGKYDPGWLGCMDCVRGGLHTGLRDQINDCQTCKGRGYHIPGGY